MNPYPPPAFQFSVSFGKSLADDEYSLQEVSGIGSSVETEEYREGGENRFVHTLPKGVKHPKLSLKRGIAPINSPLVVWCKNVLEGGFSRPIVTQVVHVALLNERGQPLRRWTFANAYPVNWEVEAFNSTKNQVAVEKIELCYSYSMRDKPEYETRVVQVGASAEAAKA